VTATRRLAGRRIVVTGAASGIGRATAMHFAEEGAALALIDRDAEGVRAVADATRGHAFAADITDEAEVNRAVEQAAAAMGGIDGVVNSAGIQVRGSVREVGVDEWRHSLEVNLTGMYIVVRACLPWLERCVGATIVNLGSGQALLANAPNRTAYAASKGGVLNLSRALAAELAPGIRVNCVCPGLVDTPMAAGVQGNVGNYALGRLAQPVEIARAIPFLTSAESSFVTGAALAADGGRSFH
jgi:NAD(P)-dependent dehydrogenase (short-subunit alcohol dehydrogenase family)